jgi:hypothetical protein
MGGGMAGLGVQLGVDIAAGGESPGEARAEDAEETKQKVEKSAKEEEKAQLDAIGLSVAAYKSGTEAKLLILQQYAALALKYYGSADVDTVKQANAKVLEANRQFQEEQERLRKEAETKSKQSADRQFREQMTADQSKVANAKLLMADSTKTLEEYTKLEEGQIEHRKDMAAEDLAFREQNLNALAAAGRITDRQELEGQRELERERYRIQAQALQDRIQLLQDDIVAQSKARAQLELLEVQHMRRIQQIDLQGMLQQQRAWAGMFQAIGNSMQPVLAKFFNFQLSVKNLFIGLGTAVADSLANMAARNISTLAAQAAAGNTIRLKEIAGDAKAAAAGAYRAIVGIPYVGPVLAPAAAAVAFGAVMAFSSARAGYDIPAGVNPVTQLHEQEMVLPKEQADVIRGMAQGSGGGGSKVSLKVKSAGRGDVIIREKDLRGMLRRLGMQGSL